MLAPHRDDADAATSASDPTDDHDDPALVISSSIFLLSAYARGGGCRRLASVIVRHLDAVTERDDVAPVIRATCAQLREHWEATLASGGDGPTLPRARGWWPRLLR